MCIRDSLCASSFTSRLGTCDFENISTSQLKPHNSSTIYLLTLLPYPQDRDTNSLQPAWNRGADILPAAELAVQHVNQDPSMLQGYRVDLVNADGGCDIATRTLTSFFKHVFKSGSTHSRGKQIAGIIGPSCSESTITVSSITCLLYTSPSPRDATLSRMPSSA